MNKAYEILVVDDSIESLQLLTDILMDQGYMVRPARDPLLALESAVSTPPDLILLDVKMPAMDGFSLCQKLKQDESTAAVPVLFISALQDMGDKVRGFEVGGVDFISKPIQRDEVLARVNVHLTIHYLQMKLKRANTELEQKVADRTKALTEANEALKEEIEERKKAEKKIAETLQEREALLREVFHRTKNNMQVISSILHLQSETEKDERLSSLLKESESRIMAMGLVHEKLYQSKSISRIDISEFIKDLASHLKVAYARQGRQISFNFDLAEVPLNIDSAVPCGLILNELLMNAFKHAFPERNSGEIGISFKKDKNKMITCIITDNGIGLPEGFDLKKLNTFGLTIAAAIVEKQLKGKIELVDSEGAGFKFTFREREYEARL